MEALKNNDVDRYYEMLLEQQTSVPGDAAQWYSILSSYLSQTEDYLHKLCGKITATKNQEVVEAAIAAAAAAHSQDKVKAAAACAGEEVMIRNQFSEINSPKDSPSINKYYNLTHAVNEKVIRQPSMLRCGTLRDYQLVGLQWMLSLYNYYNLKGTGAHEMGLAKTVQGDSEEAHHYHLVSWNRVCTSKDQGGIGIKNTRFMNRAILSKWLWRFSNESERLWRRIIVSRYGLSPFRWESRDVTIPYGCGAWKGIMKEVKDYRKNISYKVNKGDRVRFWEDVWNGDRALSRNFGNFYAMSDRKNQPAMALIAYLMEFKGNFGLHLIIVPNAVLVNWNVRRI